MMNYISAKNGNRVQNAVARSVAHHCIDKLMPRMRTLDISILFKKIPEKEYTIGTCLMQDNNRTFEIEVQKGLTFDEIVKTVCHEMVHVKQYARNEMTDSFWKGKMRWRNRFPRYHTVQCQKRRRPVLSSHRSRPPLWTPR